MAGVVGRGDRVDADAAIAFHRWRTASGRAAAQLPDALLDKAWCLFEPFVPRGFLARVSQALTWVAFAIPLGILVCGFVYRHGASIEAVFQRTGIWALVALYGFLGLDALIRGVAWLVSIGLPRRAVLREAAQLGQDANTIGLALSPALLSESDDPEVRERASCWMMLDAEAGEAERLGEAAAKVLRRGVAPLPEELELLLLCQRGATVVLYCLGMLYLWWPLFRIGMPGWMRLPIPKFPWWPAIAIVLFIAAWLLHALSGAAMRCWLGCEPRRACRLGHQLASLSRARRLRRTALEVLTDPSPSALSRARRSLYPAPEPPPRGVLDKLKYWLFAEE
jgi:hypothetical protein